jgi:hypothetical protein
MSTFFWLTRHARGALEAVKGDRTIHRAGEHVRGSSESDPKLEEAAAGRGRERLWRGGMAAEGTTQRGWDCQPSCARLGQTRHHAGKGGMVLLAVFVYADDFRNAQ